MASVQVVQLLKNSAVMKVYDYYKDGELVATFTDRHEKERNTFEGFANILFDKVKVSEFGSKAI